MDEVNQIDYAWVEKRNGFVPVASSFPDAEGHRRWSKWMNGAENVNTLASVRQPTDARVYLTDGGSAAVINRSRKGPDSRRDMSVSALVGPAARLPAWDAMTIVAWPTSPVDPAAAGDTVQLIRPSVPVKHPRTHLVGLAGKAVAQTVTINSPIADYGDVELYEPLAAVLAATLRYQIQQRQGERRQIVFVGADEPTAGALMYGLTVLLPILAKTPLPPTFSTFEAKFPEDVAQPQDPSLLFMPNFQLPKRGLYRPVSHVFLAPALKPPGEAVQHYVQPGAAGDDPMEQAARIAVAVWRAGEGGWSGVPKASDGDFATPQKWLRDLAGWAYRVGVAVPEPVPPSDLGQPEPPARPADQRYADGTLRFPAHTSSRGAADLRPAAAGQPVTASQPATVGGYQPASPAPASTEVTERTAAAEYFVRTALSDLHGGAVDNDVHTADALVAALRGRQWVSPYESIELRRFLLGVLHGLAPRELREEGEPQRSTEKRNRPNEVELLLNFEYRLWAGELSSADVVECLVALITRPRSSRVDPQQLQSELEILVDVKPGGQRRAGVADDLPVDDLPAEDLRSVAPEPTPVEDGPWQQHEPIPAPGPVPDPSIAVRKAFHGHLVELLEMAIGAAAAGSSPQDTILRIPDLIVNAAWLDQAEAHLLRNSAALRLNVALEFAESMGHPAALRSPPTDAAVLARFQTKALAEVQETTTQLEESEDLSARAVLDTLASSLRDLALTFEVLDRALLARIDNLVASVGRRLDERPVAVPAEQTYRLHEEIGRLEGQVAASRMALAGALESAYKKISKASRGEELLVLAEWFSTLPEAYPGVESAPVVRALKLRVDEMEQPNWNPAGQLAGKAAEADEPLLGTWLAYSVFLVVFAVVAAVVSIAA